jgi:hypothetical protein
MKNKYWLLKLTGCLFTVLIIGSCSKKPDNTVKTITIKTLNPSTIDFASAVSGGLITSSGDLPLLQKGICYNTSPGPTIFDSVIFSTISSDSFNCTLKGLKPATQYYIRAFAKNDAGTFYGNEVSFKMGVPYGTINYDAVYYPWRGTPYAYAYHVNDVMYYLDGQNYAWSTLIYANHDTLYRANGQVDSFGVNKGCVALVSNIDPSQQPSYPYYIGSYYKFSFFNDTAVGNLQFMVPTDNFPSIDSIPVTGIPGAGGLPGGYDLLFSGGLNSFYTGIVKAEVKISPDKDFVKFGDNFSYANPLIPAQGNIDSANMTLFIKRFSDNGIHPNSKITKTIDGHLTLTFYFQDSSRFSLINCDFYNIPFQKAPM